MFNSFKNWCRFPVPYYYLKLKINIEIVIAYFCGSRRFWFLHILWPEKELSIEIGLFNEIHVGNRDLAVFWSNTNHRKIFEQLAADGAGSHNEIPQIPCVNETMIL